MYPSTTRVSVGRIHHFISGCAAQAKRVSPPTQGQPSKTAHTEFVICDCTIEDSFTFVKDVLGGEEVQLLHLEGIRTLLALGWVAAGFLYELGVTLEWEEVRLLARLGGWIPRPNNKPGKTMLTRGLRRLLDLPSTQPFLPHYQAQHGDLPPRIATILRTGQL
jgi:hypothetical protein